MDNTRRSTWFVMGALAIFLAAPRAEAQRRRTTVVVNPPGPGRVVVRNPPGPGHTAVVVNPPGPGNRTVVRTGRHRTVVNPPGPGRVVVRHR